MSEERRTLGILISSRTAPHPQPRRARLILPVAEGVTHTDTANEVGISRPMVIPWRRFVLGWLADRPPAGPAAGVHESGSIADGGDRLYEEVAAATHRSVCSLAKAVAHGVGHTSPRTDDRTHFRSNRSPDFSNRSPRVSHRGRIS